jgi:hypothetical protein
MKKFKSAKEALEHAKRLATDPEYAKKIKEENKKEEERAEEEYWKALTKFTTSTDVPRLPKPLTTFHINRLLESGAIGINELEDGVWYYGNYRNSSYGKWNSETNEFSIIRSKFGHYYLDKCKHFQNDDGFALFVPIRKATDEEIETEENKIN